MFGSLKIHDFKKDTILTETAKEYGGNKYVYDSSIYYIVGAVIVLVLFIISTRKKEGIRTETPIIISVSKVC